MTRPFFLSLVIAAIIFLAACGRVVTREPTPTSLPVDTPTATAATAVPGTPTARPLAYMADTPTPTVSPTPIVHVVQKGDTLQAIAFDYGVSVDALQRANGVENPQFLQVGQQLVIPMEEEPGAATSDLLLPTPTPHPIEVQGVAFYETPVDSLLGLGEVANTTAVTLTNVQVEVTLLDALNQPVIQTDTFVSMDVIPPGVRSPFSILITTPPSDWVTYRVTVVRGQEAGALANAYVPVSVIEAQGAPVGPQFEVTGMAENTSDTRVAESIDFFVTAYDAEGIVTGFRRFTLGNEAIEGGLSPGEKRAFSLSLITHQGAPADFTVTAVGHTAEGIPSGG